MNKTYICLYTYVYIYIKLYVDVLELKSIKIPSVLDSKTRRKITD